MRRIRVYILFFTIVTLASVLCLARAGKKAKGAPPPETDNIAVVGHLELTGRPVQQLMAAVHWRHFYLYLVHGPQDAVTVLDVTDFTAPRPIGDIALPAEGAPLRLSTMVGTAGLLTTFQAEPQLSSETVLITSFADPLHPKILKRFVGVTRVIKESLGRGIVYLTNAEGLWVLRESPGEDIELQKEYEEYLRNYH